MYHGAEASRPVRWGRTCPHEGALGTAAAHRRQASQVVGAVRSEGLPGARRSQKVKTARAAQVS